MIAGVYGFGQRSNIETIDAQAFGTSIQIGRNFVIKIMIFEFSSTEDRNILVQHFRKGRTTGW
jgi:hypothetical protein